jgi:2-(1,2-epoxy-1,2-dihydrophenyl)acetyl-CoA isomerase
MREDTGDGPRRKEKAMNDPSGSAPLGYEDMLAIEASRDDLVEVESRGQYSLVRMNDPASLNPLNGPLTVQLLRALEGLAADQSISAVVLTGADPAFSAGGDLRAMVEQVHPMVDRSPQGATAMWRWIRYQFGGVVRLIAATDKVFIAAINGPAAGVGLAFAMACDLIIASDRARLLTAFGKIGLVPEVGLGWLLTRRLGYHKTMELFIDGTILDAAKAHELGLVNEVVPHEELLARAAEWAGRASSLPAHAVQMTKPLLRAVCDMSWEHAIAMEEFAEPACFTTAAHRAAVEALLDR